MLGAVEVPRIEAQIERMHFFGERVWTEQNLEVECRLWTVIRALQIYALNQRVQFDERYRR